MKGTESANALFQTLLEQHPEDIDLKQMYGSLLITQGKTDEARFQFQLITEMEPSDAAAWQQLLNLALKSEDIPEVIRICTRCQELFPDAKKVGLLYCSAEANSQYQVDTVKAALEKLGYTCTYYAFSDSNDLSSVATTAATESDVIYVPTDNTVASNTEIINNICLPAKVPVIAGEEGICSGCGVATLSISYYDLGKATGEMAVKILKDGEDISTMPIEYAPNFTKEYNADICAELGIEVPDDYVAIGADAE